MIGVDPPPGTMNYGTESVSVSKHFAQVGGEHLAGLRPSITARQASSALRIKTGDRRSLRDFDGRKKRDMFSITPRG